MQSNSVKATKHIKIPFNNKNTIHYT